MSANCNASVPEGPPIVSPLVMVEPVKLKIRYPDLITPDRLAVRDDYNNICRLCAAETTNPIPLFKGEGAKYDIPGKIRKYMSLRVLASELMPQTVCPPCASTLLSWHELVRSARLADFMLRRKLGASRALPIPSPPPRADGTEIIKNGVKCESPALLISVVKDVLTNYFHSLNIEGDNADFEYVCQKCDATSVGNRIEDLTEHLTTTHAAAVDCKESVEDFIRSNITFEENLMMEEFVDSDGDARSERDPSEVALPQFWCPHCSSIFSSPTRLLCHLGKHVDVDDEAGVACCGAVYSDRAALASHLRARHERLAPTGTICRTCGFSADDDGILQDHIDRVHVEARANSAERDKRKTSSGQKYIRVECPECNKMFSNKYNMAVHLRSHRARPGKFTCETCARSYRSRGSLTQHRRVVHEGELRHVCAACGEGFPSRLARDVHARLHTGHRPYSCHFCDKSYRARNTLDRHLEMHLDVRKFSCHLCSKKFRKNTHLRYHLTTHDRRTRSNRGCLLQADPASRPPKVWADAEGEPDRV